MKLEERKDEYVRFLTENMESISTDHIAIIMILASVVNRALALNRGFLQMESDENYLCAIPLVRMQIDNCIRLFAYNMAIDEETYGNWVLSGDLLNKLKDRRTNKSLTDKRVLEELIKEYPHILKLYEECSGYVHFSNKLIKYIACRPSGSRKIFMRVGDFDEFTEEAKENIRLGMDYANDSLFGIMKKIVNSFRETNE
jgi:hypothetical protein